MSRHVRHEPWTREMLGLVGGERDLPAGSSSVSWCGTRISTLELFFLDASHALLHLQGGGSAIEVCEACRLAIRAATDARVDAALLDAITERARLLGEGKKKP